VISRELARQNELDTFRTPRIVPANGRTFTMEPSLQLTTIKNPDF
jgi:hypothetical protein